MKSTARTLSRDGAWRYDLVVAKRREDVISNLLRAVHDLPPNPTRSDLWTLERKLRDTWGGDMRKESQTATLSRSGSKTTAHAAIGNADIRR